MPVIVLVADGARPDTLDAALSPRHDRQLPAMSRLRDEGGLFTVTSCFPSVTGPAYAPFLMGRYPGPVGLPGLRWFDRSRTVCSFPSYSRSYVGYEMRELDRDLSPEAPTIFELCGRSLGALSVISRGLAWRRRIGAFALSSARSWRYAMRAAKTHFRGDVAGWLRIDRDVASEVAARVRNERPEFVFVALTGVDKSSHARGHEAPVVGQALRIVDELVAELRADAERLGYWKDTQLWVTSDHGHSRVRAHDDLALGISSLGYRAIAHPWVVKIAPEVAIMVSGNAMAHLYVDLNRRRRPYWPTLRDSWEPLVRELTARASIDVMILPTSDRSCEVRARGRGSALVERSEGTRDRVRFTYRMIDGDPLGIGRDLVKVCVTEAYEATFATDYPDSIVQIANLAGATRSGDIIVSAARDWDFRARYEPIPHVSSHGALHRDHMLVPLLLGSPPAGTPRRTVDIMPSALHALGIAAPRGLDGESFLPARAA